MRLIKETHFDFVGTRKYAYIISGLLILVGIISMAIQGGLKYGIDFTGGLSMQLDLQPKVSLQQLYDAMIQDNVDSTKAAQAISMIYKAETSAVKKNTAQATTPAAADTTQVKADSLVATTIAVQDVTSRFPDLATKYASSDKVLNLLKTAGITNGDAYVTKLISGSKQVTAQMLRDAMKSGGINDAEIQEVQIPLPDDKFATGFTLRISRQEGMKDKVIEIIQKNFPETITDNQSDYIVSSDDIGAKVGKELRTKALLAIIYSCIGMIIYIWWRFRFTFGIAAVIALLHDVMTTLSMFSLLGLEIDLTVIAAILTLIGYSINDTIVVYDRIRENMRLYRKKTTAEIFNDSINETLSRTIITSLTVFIVLVCLYFFGGRVIHNFAFTLLFGVVTGTYSSIYIASPIVIEFYNYRERQDAKKKDQLKKGSKK